MDEKIFKKIRKTESRLDWFIDKQSKYKKSEIFLFGTLDKVWESLSFIIDYQYPKCKIFYNISEKIKVFKEYAEDYIKNKKDKESPYEYWPIWKSLRYTITRINAFERLRDASVSYFESKDNTKINQIKFLTDNTDFKSPNKRITRKVKKNQDIIDDFDRYLHDIEYDKYSKEESLVKLDEIATSFNGIHTFRLVKYFSEVLIEKEPCLQ